MRGCARSENSVIPEKLPMPSRGLTEIAPLSQELTEHSYVIEETNTRILLEFPGADFQ